MKISVVTVCFNAVDTIEQTMLSVLNQTYPDVEYIVIDGGSTDGTVDVIKKYAEELAYLVSEPDKGIYDAMNKGVKIATGDYVNFMNAGDSFYKDDVLEEIFSKCPAADYIVGVAAYPNGSFWKPVNETFSFKDVYHGGGVNHQASFINRDLFKSAAYNTSYKIIADELFFLEHIVFQNKKYKPVDVIVCNYDNNGVSNQTTSRKLILSERRAFLESKMPARILLDYDETIWHKNLSALSMFLCQVRKKISRILFLKNTYGK